MMVGHHGHLTVMITSLSLSMIDRMRDSVSAHALSKPAYLVRLSAVGSFSPDSHAWTVCRDTFNSRPIAALVTPNNSRRRVRSGIGGNSITGIRSERLIAIPPEIRLKE